MTLKAVIMNDTRSDNHFGCFRVMRIIEENLAARGIRVTARSPVRHEWAKDAAFLAALSESDVVVINGEGTLHHGARRGEMVLRVVDHPACAGKPVALINALYQDNPDAWGRYLEKIALISTRDSRSAAAAARHSGKPVGFVPDLSLCEAFAMPAVPVERNRLLVGDSISKDISRTLLQIVEERPDAYLLPITKALKASKAHLPLPLRAFREGYIRLHAAAFRLKQPRVLFNKTEAGFLQDLLTGYLHVTGRFHSVCLCLVTRTPFLAVDSNSWKISALLEDLGLGKERLLSPQDLKSRAGNPQAASYSEDELATIEASLRQCQDKARHLFDDIARLAASAKTA